MIITITLMVYTEAKGILDLVGVVFFSCVTSMVISIIPRHGCRGYRSRL